MRAHCTTGVEKTVADLSVTEAARQRSLPMNKQDKTPLPRGLAATDPPPILSPLIPTPTVRTQRPPAPTCLPGKEEEEVGPLERKETALIVSLNFEQVEYLSERGCFIKRSEENIKREHKRDFHPSS